MNAEKCPGQERISAYLLGVLNEREADEIDRHLTRCPSCQGIADAVELVEDALVGSLKEPAQDEFLGEPAYGRALARVEAIPCGGGPVGDRAGVAHGHHSSVPHRLGAFELIEPIAHGGMGTVYRALQTDLNRIVALKILAAHPTDKTQAVPRFHKEIEAIGQLDHPNIVRAIAAGSERGIHYLVMDFVEGHDLAALRRSVSPLSIADACEIARQAAVALQCIYENGMVHRDVKPSNFMLDHRGHVKLLDLGLSRLKPESARENSLTATGTLMGTYDYMSPEQCRDSRNVSIRSDLYSLGCTLYELLCGRPPFTGPAFSSAAEKMAGHLRAAPPPIRERRPDVPDALVHLIDRLLAKEPRDRFATPRELADALTPFAIDSDLATHFQWASRQAQAKVETVGTRADTERAVRPDTVDSPRAADLKPATRGGQRPRTYWWRILAAAAIAGVIALGMVIYVNRTRIEVPEGSGVTINEDGAIHIDLPESARPKEAFFSRQQAAEIATAYNSAIEFPGDIYFEIPSLAYDGSHPITVEASITPRRVDIEQFVVGDFNDSGIMLRINTSGQLQLVSGHTRNAHMATSEKPLTVGRAVHVAGTLDGHDMTLFVEGREVASMVFTDRRYRPPSSGFRIGAYFGGTGEFYGTIDEVRISNVARYHKDFTPPGSRDRFSPDENTLALYHFDEGRGEVLRDASGNGHQAQMDGGGLKRGAKWLPGCGTGIGGPRPVQAPETAAGTNYALEFDSEGDHVEIPSLKLDGMAPTTVEANVTPQGKQQLYTFVFESGVKDRGYTKIHCAGKFGGVVVQSDGREYTNASVPPVDGRQVHLALVWDGEKVQFFVEGQREGNSHPGKPLSLTPDGAYVGGKPVKDNVYSFTGKIDELRVSNIARYDENFIAPGPGERYTPDKHTVALYHFDEGTGDVLHDASGNGHHGRIVGAKWGRVENPKERVTQLKAESEEPGAESVKPAEDPKDGGRR